MNHFRSQRNLRSNHLLIRKVVSLADGHAGSLAGFRITFEKEADVGIGYEGFYRQNDISHIPAYHKKKQADSSFTLSPESRLKSGDRGLKHDYYQ